MLPLLQKLLVHLSLLNRSVDYAKERKQFGRPIGSFQAVKHMCAQMASDLEPCYSMVWYAAHSIDHIPHEAILWRVKQKHIFQKWVHL